MLERIMDLQILLYLMTVLGTAGAIGMLAVHLTYRRTLRKTKATTNLREKWLNLWKTDEFPGMDSITAIYCMSGNVAFFYIQNP